MGIKQYKPTTPGRRNMSVSDFCEITSTEAEKKLMVALPKKGGRNSRGIITTRHRGGGAKRFYRIIDFKRNDRDNITAKVASIEYDPNRSARIALLHYADGIKRYMLAPVGLKVGMHVMAGEKVEPEVGNCMLLSNIPLGSKIHNVEMRPNQGGLIGRAAGMEVTLMAREGKMATILMPSGELRMVAVNCRATLGTVGNIEHSLIKIGKAGRSRHMGRRPRVRGSAMNPVDHPMGGGEGRRSGGRAPKGPAGTLSKGGNTRNPRNVNNKYIIRKRKKK